MRKENSDSKNINILLLDDEPAILESLKSIIERNGYHCFSTTNVSEAIEMLKDHDTDIDIFIIDYLMIGLTAEKVIEEIRSFNDNLYIILLTGFAQNIPALYALKNFKIDSYSEKSPDFSDLLLKIEIGLKSIQKQKPAKYKNSGLEFHEKLKQLRVENNKTQDEIAEYLGVVRTTVVNYEKGRIKPTLENTKKLAELYNVTCDYLLD